VKARAHARLRRAGLGLAACVAALAGAGPPAARGGPAARGLWIAAAAADTLGVPVRPYQPRVILSPRERLFRAPNDSSGGAADSALMIGEAPDSLHQGARSAGRRGPAGGTGAAARAPAWARDFQGRTTSLHLRFTLSSGADVRVSATVPQPGRPPALQSLPPFLGPVDAVAPDTAWSGHDLNADGEPDAVIRHAVRERPLTGQWIDVAGVSGGRLRLLLTRTPERVPKSVVALRGAPQPLILAVEPHLEGWPAERTDPPGRSVLLALRDTLVADVSRAHPEWFAPQVQAAELQLAELEGRGDHGGDWADALLQRTWGLLALGRRDEARVLFEGRLARTRDLPEALRAYLEQLRPGLEAEWKEH